jgi:hypothetical protein
MTASFDESSQRIDICKYRLGEPARCRADQDYAEIRKLAARRSEPGEKVFYNVHKKRPKKRCGGGACEMLAVL